MNVLVKFTNIGTDVGTFNLFSDVSVPPYCCAFATGVTRQQLLNGYPAIAPDGTNYIRLISSGVCAIQLSLQVPGGITTTTTSTSSTTTTTSTTLTPTTTTTTTVTYQYSADGYFCSTCAVSGAPGGMIRNHTPLTIGKYYFFTGSNPPQMTKILSFIGTITTPAVHFLIDADGSFTCPSPACPTTTTTTTLPTFRAWHFSSPGRASSAQACLDTSFPNVWYTNYQIGIAPAMGSILYHNSDLTGPVNGLDQWYSLGEAFADSPVAYQIGTDGSIDFFFNC